MSAIDTGDNPPRDGTEQDTDSHISVGGLGAKLAAIERQERCQEVAAVGKVVELRRRERGLSPEQLAIRSHVTEDALFDLERGLRMPNTRDIIRLVSAILDLPAEKLIVAAGLSGPPDPVLSSAALQLANQVKRPEHLSPLNMQRSTSSWLHSQESRTIPGRGDCVKFSRIVRHSGIFSPLLAKCAMPVEGVP